MCVTTPYINTSYNQFQSAISTMNIPDNIDVSLFKERNEG
jgi:hypothetical protein